jgi:hypothetical protein
MALRSVLGAEILGQVREGQKGMFVATRYVDHTMFGSLGYSLGYMKAPTERSPIF